MKLKNIIASAVVALSLGGVVAEAQTVKAPAFARPLVERWVAEYNKAFSASLTVAEASQAGDIRIDATASADEADVTYVGRYAILPFVGRGSEAERVLSRRKLSRRRLESLYFVSDDEEEEEENKLAKAVTVYSGSNAASVTQVFARSFGHQASDLRGKRISGDDKFLNVAVGRDQKGVAFNAVSNLFDLKTRQLRAEVSLLPLDAPRAVADAFDGTATLDQIVDALERETVDGTVVSPLALTVANDSQAVREFVTWVVTAGQAYNHEYGVLSLDQQLIASHP